MDYSILIDGAAGQGLDTSANILEKVLKRSGFYVFTYRDYMSMVRGGHNFTQIRFSDSDITSFTEEVNIILALNKETIEVHKDRLKDDGAIICGEEIAAGENIISLPMGKIASDINPRVYNTVGLGAVLKYFGLPVKLAEDVLNEEFKEKTAQDNIDAVNEGYKLIDNKCKLEVKEDNNIIINGNDALSLGAIAAGCKYYCGYPMTPATSILKYFSYKSEAVGIAVDQVEDEVAALNMALGAS